MPPHARHRLDLLILPHDPNAPATGMEATVERLRQAGLWPDGVGDGGPARLVVAPRQRFVANRQGGFHVVCPVTHTSVALEFGRALEGWRGGGPRALPCQCGAVHDLVDLAYAPAAGFACAWIEVPDVETPEPTSRAATVLGDVRIVLRRG